MNKIFAHKNFIYKSTIILTSLKCRFAMAVLGLLIYKLFIIILQLNIYKKHIMIFAIFLIKQAFQHTLCVKFPEQHKKCFF